MPFVHNLVTYICYNTRCDLSRRRKEDEKEGVSEAEAVTGGCKGRPLCSSAARSDGLGARGTRENDKRRGQGLPS